MASLLYLTHLRLGLSFHLEELPQILPNMTRLQLLRLLSQFWKVEQFTVLSTLASLTKLELLDECQVAELPSWQR
jgi:hypothetical protein